MKLLTDENIAVSIVRELRKVGFDVKDIKDESLYGISDKEIIQISSKEKRIILTHDKDFINLANTTIKHNGIILLRFKNQSPSNVKKYILQALRSKIGDKMVGKVTIISETKVVIHS